MDVNMVFVLILFVHAIHYLIASSAVNKMHRGEPDKAFDGSCMSETEAPSEIACCSECLQDERCWSVNFHKGTGRCEMFYSQNATSVSRPGWKMYSKEGDGPPAPPNITAHTRLVNGNTCNEGRIEVFLDGQWGTVCDDSFGDTDATVVCKSLGFRGFKFYPGQAHFGRGVGPIMMDDVFCTGSETSLHECRYLNSSSHNCRHQEDQGITCDV